LIDDFTFQACCGLTFVVIPDSVTSIGHCAFQGCKALADVVIPNTVTSITGSAFNGCSLLSSIELPRRCDLVFPGVDNVRDGTIFCDGTDVTVTRR
jgi:hypothetical protein